MSNPSLADPLSLGSPVPNNARCQGKVLVLLAFLIGFGLTMILVPRAGVGEAPITMPLYMQPAQLSRAMMPPNMMSRQFMQPTRVWPVATKAQPIWAAASGEPFLKVGDVVTHQKRGQGKVVQVEPVVQVKYDEDPEPEPIDYTDEDGKPLPESVLRSKLTLVSSDGAQETDEAPSE